MPRCPVQLALLTFWRNLTTTHPRPQSPPTPQRLLLACSAGGDSVALTHAAAHLHRHNVLPAELRVAHVHHHLRGPDADADAQAAATLADTLGLPFHLLHLDSDALRAASNLESAARDARYAALAGLCRPGDAVWTAHHADDQAETVQMRIARGTGWRGASGMQPRSYAPVWPALAGVTLVRPALRLSRDELQPSLGKLEPIADPSNENTDFERIRVRKALSRDPSRRAQFLELSDKLAAGRVAERERLAAVLDGHAMTHEGQLSLRSLAPLDALATLAPIVGGQQGPVDRSRLRAGREALKSGAPVALGGGCIGDWDGEQLVLSRDPVAMTGRSDGGLVPTAERLEIGPEPQVWDGRFLISGESGVVNPERRGRHVGFRILFGRDVRVRNLVAERIQHSCAP